MSKISVYLEIVKKNSIKKQKTPVTIGPSYLYLNSIAIPERGLVPLDIHWLFYMDFLGIVNVPRWREYWGQQWGRNKLVTNITMFGSSTYKASKNYH